MPTFLQGPPPPKLPEAPIPQVPQAPPAATSVKNTQDYATLKARYDEYYNQLRNAERRRDNVAQELARTGNETTRNALQQRLAGIDKQILQLDADMNETGRLMALAAPARNTIIQVPPPDLVRRQNNDEAAAVLSGLFIVLVMFPIAIAFARRLWKRPIPQTTPANWADTPARLERLETAVDTIAVEIERVSESQRFMTRLMTETQLGSTVASVRASHEAARNEVADPFEPPAIKALGAGEKPFEPVKVNEREELKIRREG
jgi:hypothetical protein